MVERMAELVRDLHADHQKHDLHDRVNDFCVRTAAIVAELPKPIDPDLIEARELVVVGNESFPTWCSDVRKGLHDTSEEVRLALAGIRRGRELTQGNQS
jgi:hypothetical protein